MPRKLLQYYKVSCDTAAMRYFVLESCGLVTGVQELLDLPTLKTLGINKCESIEPKEALLELRGLEIGVTGRIMTFVMFGLIVAEV